MVGVDRGLSAGSVEPPNTLEQGVLRVDKLLAQQVEKLSAGIQTTNIFYCLLSVITTNNYQQCYVG